MAREALPAILEATVQVIAKDGVDAVRYRRVAQEARVPLGTVSYHFAAREELIRAAFAYFLEWNAGRVAAQRARFSGETLDDVAGFLAELVRADFADPSRRYLAEYELVVYAGRDPSLAPGLAAWDRARIGELAAVLESLGVRRPIAAARTAVDVVRGFQVANLGARPADVGDLRERLADLFRALGASPPAAPAAPSARRRAPPRRRR